MIWSVNAEQQKHAYLQKSTLSPQTIDELEQVLSLDPRPAYQNDETRIYGMHFSNIEVKFQVTEQAVVIQDLLHVE